MLRQLAPNADPNLIVGTSTYDDAGVYRLNAETALVQTVDFFPPLVDDPYDFGRIAATNALSDVYAMGGAPLTALNIVGFPDKELESDVLAEILRGGADMARLAGCAIVGGHSVRDAEVKYGMAVTGLVHPDRVWTNAGARPGDALILTKPIGSGVLTTAVKQGKLPPEALREAVDVMTTLNRAARDVAVEFEIHACTDITGFGLIGHAFEMAAGSGVTITLHASRVPLMAQTIEMARLGVLTRAHRSTREHVGDRLVVDAGVEPALAGVLLDAQTSGGLLLALESGKADALLECLRRVGVAAARVGECTDTGSPGEIRLLP